MQFPHDTVPTSIARITESTPSWLRFEAPANLPKALYELVTSYYLTATAVIERHPPKKVTMRILFTGHCLKFDVVLSSEKEWTKEKTALSTIARNFEFVSMFICKAEFAKSDESQTQESKQDLYVSHTSKLPDSEDVIKIHRDPEASHNSPERTDVIVKIFDWPKEIEADGGRDRGRDGDSASRMRKTVTRLLATGPDRPLRAPPTDWQAKIDRLAVQFPNFSAVVETVVRPHVAMMAMGIEHRMPPVALIGPPGVGKTYFAQALAEALGLDAYKFVPMAAETNGSTLAGSSTFWSNSAPGDLFETLAWGSKSSQAVANPLLVLDEIDKSQPDRFSPLGALYSLLEVETARCFQDQSLPDVTIDASYVRIIATANDTCLIPEPLLSRLLVVHVELPSRQQLEAVIRSIYSAVIKRLKIPISDELPDAVLDIATTMSPRESKVRLECAVAKAFSEGRDRVAVSDWPLLGVSRQVVRRGIGFIAG